MSSDCDFGDIKMAARLDDHPEGSMTWLLCDGRAVSRVTYAQLFAITGVAFGPGDGLTTFNIPRFTTGGGVKGRFPVGVHALAYALGAVSGVERHVHNMNVMIGTLTHVVGLLTGDPGFPATPVAGVNVIGVPHTHSMPVLNHSGGPWLSDPLAADVINPWVAVGFFIRAL